MTQAQEFHLSTPGKMTSKTPHFQVLGKNQSGILVHKYGKKNSIIEAYNSDLKLRWKKEMSFKEPGAQVKAVIPSLTRLHVFYFAQYKGYTKLHLQSLDDKLKPVGRAIHIDSIPGYKDQVFNKFRVINSLDKTKTMVYQPAYGDKGLEYVKVMCFNQSMKLLYRRRIEPGYSEKETKLRKTMVDNDGNGYWVIYETIKPNRRQTAIQNEFYLLKYMHETRQFDKIALNIDIPLVNGLKVDLDNANNRMVMTGLYALNEDEGAKGVFYQVIDLETQEAITTSLTPLDHEMIRGITGKDSSSNFDGLFSFSLSRVIPRFDGGAIAIAESRFDNSESVQMTSIVASTTPSFRTVNIIYFNDVVVFSIDPQGQIEWSSILRKKQVSEDDDGFYSSYALVMDKDKLRFVYNEEVFPKTNINEYALASNGEQRRNTIFNAADFNIMLVPQLAKQVTSNELVIPSYRRNYLRLVKINY